MGKRHYNNHRHSKLFLALLLASASIGLGVTFFYFWENYNLPDAIYMTAITVSTVGYGTVGHLSSVSKILLSGYIFFNLGVFAFLVSVITQYIFEGELNEIYKKFMEEKRVSKLKNHVIIVGFGRNGLRASQELHEQNIDFVIVDSNPEPLQYDNTNNKNFHFLEGDATNDDILIKAGLMCAKAIIITLPHDADNVYISLTARELNKDINIIARASEVPSEKKLLRAGANHIVMPDALGGIHMARLIAKPAVVRFLELLNGAEEHVELDEFSFEDFNFAYRTKSLRDLMIRDKTGVTVLGIKGENTAFRFNPSPDLTIQSGEVIIILGSPKNIEDFHKRYGY